MHGIKDNSAEGRITSIGFGKFAISNRAKSIGFISSLRGHVLKHRTHLGKSGKPGNRK